jgi:hypothetical protein
MFAFVANTKKSGPFGHVSGLNVARLIIIVINNVIKPKTNAAAGKNCEAPGIFDLTKFRSMAFVLELERPRVNFESSFIASLPSPLLLLLAFDTDVADVSSKCIEDVSIILFNIDTFCCSLEEDTIVEGELEEEEEEKLSLLLLLLNLLFIIYVI